MTVLVINAKYTPWVNGDIKPVNIGMYEVRVKEGLSIYYSYWDGEYWRGLHDEINKVNTTYKCLRQNRDWRGIAYVY